MKVNFLKSLMKTFERLLMKDKVAKLNLAAMKGWQLLVELVEVVMAS